MIDSAVPVRPVPPLQAISTRWVAARLWASCSSSMACSVDFGRPKSRHGIHSVGQLASDGLWPNRYTPSSGSCEESIGLLRPLPRTRRPSGNSIIPGPGCHAPMSDSPILCEVSIDCRRQMLCRPQPTKVLGKMQLPRRQPLLKALTNLPGQQLKVRGLTY